MRDDRFAVTDLASVSNGDAPHLIVHYLYLPNQKIASSVAAELHDSGFETVVRLGADGTNWLVLARHVIVPTEDSLAAVRRTLETLAGKQGGEYDGWEAEIENKNP